MEEVNVNVELQFMYIPNRRLRCWSSTVTAAWHATQFGNNVVLTTFIVSVAVNFNARQ